MNKIINIIKVILNAIMTIIITLGTIFIILYIIGIQPFVIESGSMEPQIQTGSVCFINKLVKYDEIKVNDIIAFKLPTGDSVTHRVVSVTNEGFRTKGDNNDVEDGIYTTENNYIGKNIFSIPNVGYAVKLVQTTRGKIILGTVIVILFLSAFLIGKPSKTKNKQEKIKDNNN